MCKVRRKSDIRAWITPSLRLGKIFLAVYFSLLILFNVVVGVLLVRWDYIPGLIYYFSMQLFNVQFVYTLTETLLSLIVKHDHDLPCIDDELSHTPRVALLYLTCDDANPKIIETLSQQAYPNYQVFILDNSVSVKYTSLVDKSGFTVVRDPRDDSHSSKAGSMNYWLRKYEDEFKYFVILDSDSIIPPDFVTKMIRYAEHPLNDQVAIFQSQTRTWNIGNRIARTLSAMEPLWYLPLKRLANRCNMLLPWGHNILCRTEAILQAGGFDENFLSEDYEIAVRLLQTGYTSKLVNVFSWDAMPETIESYVNRSVRWAQGILQIIMHEVEPIPFVVKLRLFMTAYSYWVQILYVAALFIIVWSYRSSLRHVYVFGSFIFTGSFLETAFWRSLVIIGLYLSFYLIFHPLVARRLGVSLRQYFLQSVLGVVIGLYSVWPLTRELWYTLRTGKGKRIVTPKPGMEMRRRLKIQSLLPGLIFSIVILVGVIRNPISFVFNFMWLIPMMLSPLILYWTQQAETYEVSPDVAELYPQLIENQ